MKYIFLLLALIPATCFGQTIATRTRALGTDTVYNATTWNGNLAAPTMNAVRDKIETIGGGGGAPTDATYITQTANGTLSAEQALGSLSTGLMQVTTTTGVVSAVTTSAGVSGLLSDETGSGALVFATAPVFPTTVNMTSGAITADTPLAITQTWNNAGVGFHCIDMTVTATAAHAASDFIRGQRSGTNTFRVTQFGNIIIANNSFSIGTDANIGDVHYSRFAANHPLIHNLTNGQTLSIANTYTNTSNYEFGQLSWTTNVFRIGPVALGTGTARNMELATSGTPRLTFVAAGGATWSTNEAVSRATVTYSASMTPDARAAHTHTITATNGTAFTINAPTNPVAGQRIRFTIRNTSGGALGTVTWNAAFKMAAWTSPATANSRTIEFEYDGTNWIEHFRTPADVPN